jgi:tripartite-type tricarboxylate transporter receptor subunit TctC
VIWQGFVGLFAPKGTPGPIIERVAQVARTALTDTDLQKNWIAAGMEPDLDSTPEKTRHLVEDEIKRLSPIVKATEFKLD